MTYYCVKIGGTIMIDLEKAYNIAETAVRKSGEHLMNNFGNNHALYNRNKIKREVSSKLDDESNHIIIETIISKWFELGDNTKILILSEETLYPIIAIKNDKEKIECTDYKGNLQEWNDYCWVIDPICGSIAYARGIRDFIISITLVQNHQALLAVVYDPSYNELFHAVCGEGAYLNGTKIRPSNISSLDEAVVSIEQKVIRDVIPEIIRNIALKVRRMRTAMTCALEMCYVACGRIDAAIKLDQAFYDYIGGALILFEASYNKVGLVNLKTGKSILPFSRLGCRVSFIASNGLVIDELMQMINR